MAQFISVFWVLFASLACLYPSGTGKDASSRPQKAPWELKKDENGIRVYTRPISDSSVEEFKAVATLNCTLEALLAVARTPNNYKHWIADCKNSELIKDTGPNSKIAYLQLGMPWPVKNRDLVLQVRIRQLNKAPDYLVQLTTETGIVPEKEGFVRIPAAKGFFRFTETGNNKVQVEYQFHADPGGHIPGSLVNTQIVKAPYQTMVNLRKLVNG